MEENAVEPLVEIAGLQLRFKRDGNIVNVTRAEDGLFVANVFRLHTESPSVRPSSRFRDVLGGSDIDHQGAHVRKVIAAHAAEAYKRHD